jgi:P27 family predicted phage terminase small subunit
MAERERGLAPPADLDGPARRLWYGLQRHLREQGTWQPSDLGALERYVRAVLRADRARAELEQAGSLTTAGSQGQPVAHPALRIAREAERDAAEYARDLLLTPAARRRAGIVETSDADAELAELLG